MKSADFVDGMLILGIPSTFWGVFVDGSPIGAISATFLGEVLLF